MANELNSGPEKWKIGIPPCIQRHHASAPPTASKSNHKPSKPHHNNKNMHAKHKAKLYIYTFRPTTALCKVGATLHVAELLVQGRPPHCTTMHGCRSWRLYNSDRWHCERAHLPIDIVPLRLCKFASNSQPLIHFLWLEKSTAW